MKQFPSAYRITHWKDIIPHVPSKILGYRHFGTEIFYFKDWINYKICDGSGEDDKCSNQFLMGLTENDHMNGFN